MEGPDRVVTSATGMPGTRWKGRTCPALTNASRPVAMLRNPTKSVTNMPPSLFLQSSSFSTAAKSEGRGGAPVAAANCSADARSRLRARAMNSAAGMPLPDTSPTARHNTPGAASKQSYRSPPTSRAGTIMACTDTGWGRVDGREFGRNHTELLPPRPRPTRPPAAPTAGRPRPAAASSPARCRVGRAATPG